MAVYLVIQGYGELTVSGDWCEGEFVTAVYPNLELAKEHMRCMRTAYLSADKTLEFHDCDLEEFDNQYTVKQYEFSRNSEDDITFCRIDKREISDHVLFNEGS